MSKLTEIIDRFEPNLNKHYNWQPERCNSNLDYWKYITDPYTFKVRDGWSLFRVGSEISYQQNNGVGFNMEFNPFASAYNKILISKI